MVATRNYRRLTARVVPIAFGLFGLTVAAIVAALPATLFETLSSALHWPLGSGVAGRSTAALAAGGLIAAIGIAPAMLRRRRTIFDDMLVVRRADAHPDAPPRRPIYAAEDLGPPLPPPAPRKAVPVEAELPADLDQPLAAFDPAAIPDAPRDPVRAVAPLAAVEHVRSVLPAPLPRVSRPALIDPGERFETFALVPPMPAADDNEPLACSTTIAALLDRLERAMPRRTADAPRPPASVDETLGMLRRLAAG